MKYKIIGDKPPEKPKENYFLIEDDSFWRCAKCNILYGKGENILLIAGYKFCPIHKEEVIYSADLDYWKTRFIIE